MSQFFSTQDVTYRFTYGTTCVTLFSMIKTFKSKAIKELFETGTTRRIDAKFHARCREVLDVINASPDTRSMGLPGYNLHPLKQFKPVRYSIWISGAWRVTFEFEKGDAYRVDFEQYH